MCSHDTVFASNLLELSPSLEYNSRDFSISPMLKLLYLTSFSEVLKIYSFLCSLQIQINEWFKYVIKIPDLNTVLDVYTLFLNIANLHGWSGLSPLAVIQYGGPTGDVTSVWANTVSQTVGPITFSYCLKWATWNVITRPFLTSKKRL